MQRTLEETLAFHCAPALTGLKPASLISCDYEQYPLLEGDLLLLNRQLNPAGIFFRPVCRCDSRVLLLVYRRQTLAQHLREHAQQAYLRREGYPTASLENALLHLEERLGGMGEFPHELGIFLGYPPEDVEGFRRNGGKHCKLCGYWKVYGDEKRARELFSRFTRCRRTIYSLVQNGNTLVQIFSAA